VREDPGNHRRVVPFATHGLYWPFEDPAEAEGSPEERLPTS